jgi:AcrR family transcriptional regulator
MAMQRAERAVDYERLALERFAESGYRNITMQQIAHDAGVSTRTFFRYFRTKEEILLALPRRHAQGLIDALETLPLSEDPVASVWELLIGMSARQLESVEQLALWHRASVDAPEVRARAAGERDAVVAALTEYCAACLGVDAAVDIRPSILGAALHAAERSVLAFWEQHEDQRQLTQFFAEAMDALRGIGQRRSRRPPQNVANLRRTR